MPRHLALRSAPLALLVALGPACGPAPAPSAPGPRGGEASSRFDQTEDEVLRDLAAIDRRIAQRARLTPSDEDLRRVAMSAVLREDATVAVVDGAIDPLSFDARARGLDAAKQKLAALPAEGPGPRAGERELLSRLVGAEVARLEEERELPRSASALVRAIVDTWRPPEGERDAADVDRWLARRLSELGASIERAGGAELDVVRARELDDALDALERLTSTTGLEATTQELVSVRGALEAAASKPAAGAHSDWSSVATRAKAHLGVSASPEELARELGALEALLRSRAEDAIDAARLSRDALASALEGEVFASGACVDAVPGSRVRSIAAPPEREPACHLRHLVARAEDGAARAVALSAMHEHVVVAEWALDVARGAATLAEAEGKHHLLVPVLPDARARYERIALARPVAALAAGAAVSILLGSGDPGDRARAWSRIGDVPLDVARREIEGR